MAFRIGNVLKIGLNPSISYRSNSQGTIRQAGGSFKDREVGEEARYFRKLEFELLKTLKKESHVLHEKMIKIHEQCIKDHEKGIARVEELRHRVTELEH
jgi:hypothetical protein